VGLFYYESRPASIEPQQLNYVLDVDTNGGTAEVKLDIDDKSLVEIETAHGTIFPLSDGSIIRFLPKEVSPPTEGITVEELESTLGIMDGTFYLFKVELDDGREIRILPNGELEFEGDLSEQAVEFWRELASGVPIWTDEICSAANYRKVG